MEEEKKPAEEPAEDLGHVPESTNIVEEARKIRDEILAAKDALKSENDRKEKIQAESLLASSAGGGIKEPQMKRDETPKEYKDRILRGEMND